MYTVKNMGPAKLTEELKRNNKEYGVAMFYDCNNPIIVTSHPYPEYLRCPAGYTIKKTSEGMIISNKNHAEGGICEQYEIYCAKPVK